MTLLDDLLIASAEAVTREFYKLLVNEKERVGQEKKRNLHVQSVCQYCAGRGCSSCNYTGKRP